jgi:signal peptidase II
MKLKTRVILIPLILFVSVISDQLTKKIAQAFLAGHEKISFFHNVFVLQYTENTGGFLGMGAAIPESIRFWVFSVVVALFLVLLLVYLVFSKAFTFGQVFALSAVIGGGTGNLIDRLLNDGRVVDFMNAGIGPLRTGVFNVADMLITFGSILLFILLLVKGRKNNEKKPESTVKPGSGE